MWLLQHLTWALRVENVQRVVNNASNLSLLSQYTHTGPNPKKPL